MIVLDTHIWVGLINGDAKLKARGLHKYIEGFVRTHSIYLPAISLWEVSMLVAKGRISISGSASDWIQRASSAPGISVYPLSPEVAYESSFLPGPFHGDPADRIIAATARILNAPLCTFDKEMIAYGKKGHLEIAPL